ncbi:MAG: NADH:flavin oxidoreductase [Deltaproteobacteria bacterium]|nr:NADH:flavin oxidoreductase [Deltaproteobacteria bacterium]
MPAAGAGRAEQGEEVKHAIPDEDWPTPEEAARSRLFSPLALTPTCTLSSRTWVPAMVPWRATDAGEVTADNVAWYGRFAAGEPGVVVVEATGIRDVPSGPLLRIGHERYLDGLKRIADVIHERSGGRTRAFIQLIDFLAIRRRPEPARFFERFLAVTPEHRRALARRDGRDWEAAPETEVRARLAALDEAQRADILGARELEALRMGHRERVTDTHLPHIAELPKVLPQLFADACARAERAGFDGVELHYAHAYTMASFLSRLNTRGDGYGGGLPGRVRLPLEVLRACRAALRPSTVLGCRMLCDEAIPGGSDVDDACTIAVELGHAGMDFISLSRGGKFEDARQPRIGEAAYPYTGPSGHACMPTIRVDGDGPLGRNLPLARRVRDALRTAGLATPTVAAGGIVGFRLAERALQEGACDLVASARQSLADPDWWLKVRTGRGAEVRRCKLTNYCEALDQRHRRVTCQLWDRLPGDDVPRDDGRRLLPPPWNR